MSVNPIITVIVVTPRIRAHLKRCLESVLMQTFTNYEILVIHEGTIDENSSMYDEYTAMDERIRILHQKGMGPGGAIKTGLSNMKGLYALIIEGSSILISPDYIRIMYEATRDTDTKISACGLKQMSVFDDLKSIEPMREEIGITTYSGKEIIRGESKEVRVERFSVFYGILCRRDCFKGLIIPEDKLNIGPFIFHHIIYPRTKIAVVSIPMYGRQKNPAQMFGNGNGSRIYKETLQAFDDCISFLSEHEDKRALEIAKMRRKRHSVGWFNYAIDDKTADEIPEEIRPKASYYEELYSHSEIMRMIDVNDPQAHYAHTQQLIKNANIYTETLVMMAVNMVFGDNISDIASRAKADIGRISTIADTEGMGFIFNETMLRIADPEEKSYASYSNRRMTAIRRAVIRENTLKTIERRMYQERIHFARFVPDKIISLYPNPWFRDNCENIFLIEEPDLDKIRGLMEEEGFTEINPNVIEAVRRSELCFKNESDIAVTYSVGAPFVMFGECENYLDCICKELIHKKRNMTLREYAVILTAKLHGIQIHTTSATLTDVMDLAVIISECPDLKNDENFMHTLTKLGVKETWEGYSTICRKLIQISGGVCNLTLADGEKELLGRIIRHTHFRMSYIRKRIPENAEDTSKAPPVGYTLSREKRVAYLINCKVACSSIKATLVGGDIPDDYSVHKRAVINGMQKGKLVGEEKDFFTFTFVRNPFSRLVSCYESKYHVDREKYKLISDFKTYLDGYFTLDHGFTDFVHRVCSLPYFLMNAHFCRQHDIIFDKDDQSRCDYIGHYENLSQEYEEIMGGYHLKPLPHFNKSNTKNWMDYYTPETAELVYRTFKSDFDVFGYEESYIELMEYLGSGDDGVFCM